MTRAQDRRDTPGATDWPARLAEFGPASRVRAISHDTFARASGPTTSPEEQDPAKTEVSLRELLLRGRRGNRTPGDIFCMLRQDYDSGDGKLARELVFVGPERFAGHLATTTEGVRVSDVQLLTNVTDLVRLDLLVLRAPRRVRTQAACASLQILSDCLDFGRDRVGSDAVANLMISRLESILAIDGCDVLIAGSVGLAGQAVADGAHYLWLGADAPGQLETEMHVADGRLIQRRSTRTDNTDFGTHGTASDTDAFDYALLRIGPAPAKSSPVRSLAELRRRYLLAGGEAHERGDNPHANSWSERARHSRAISDADRIMRAVKIGDDSAASEALHQALQRPDAFVELGEQLSVRTQTPPDFWGVYDVLQKQVTAAPKPTDDTIAAATVVADSLLGSYARLLGFQHVPESDDRIPVLTPTVLEIGDDLIPFVDSRQDDGHFLYELVPAMKERIKDNVGVVVPGVRARGTGTADDACVVMVEEVPRLKTYVQPAEELVVRAWPGGSPPAESVVTTLHPVSGVSGVWLIQPGPLPDNMGANSEHFEPISTPQLLIHHLEMTLRQSLAFYLGPQEVTTLVHDWDAELEGLATATASGTDAQLRLTWILQALLREQVPITRGELLLQTIREAPSSSTPTDFHRLLRNALRAQLPGPRDGDLLVMLPPELESDMVGTSKSMRTVDFINFQGWLRGTASELGPAFSLVTRSHEARESVSMATQGLYPLITTFFVPELEP